MSRVGLDDVLLVPAVCCLSFGVGWRFGAWAALVVIGVLGLVAGVLVARSGDAA